MRMKFVVLVALAALLLCALGGAALATATPAPEDTMTTQAQILFTEAIFFYDFTDEGGGMDINYGEQELPLGVETFIPAADGNHVLRVCERRAVGGKWSISAVMTPMTSGDESFTGELQLYSPTLSSGLTATLTGTAPNQRASVGTASSKVVEATGDLVPTDYDLKVTAANTRLRIPADQALLIKPLVYTGTVTWTLTLTA